MSESVYQIIEKSAASWPNNVAIVDSRGSLTYSQLQKQIEVLKSRLQSGGIKPGMGVGVMGQNSREFITTAFAVLGCGACVMPMSQQLRKNEVETIVDRAGLHAIIDETDDWKPSFTQVTLDKRFADLVEDPAFVRFTSGTTGTSKGVVISGKSVLERIDAANKALLLNSEDVVIWVLPMSFHFIVSIVLYLHVGATIAICADFTAESILDCCIENDGTMLYASPMHVKLLANDQSQKEMPSMKTVISTSSGVSLKDCMAFKERFDIPITQAYGIIEVGLPLINTIENTNNPDAIGHALPDFEVEILNEQLEVRKAGEIGQLAMKGPGMFSAYLSPAKTKEEVLHNGWFLTGDLAIKDADGLVKITGRQNSVINVSGNKVFPEEVEHILNSNRAVKISKVYGTKHALLGEVVQADVVIKEGMEVDQEELHAYCAERLSIFKVPKRFEFVSSLKMTNSGKVSRV